MGEIATIITYHTQRAILKYNTGIFPRVDSFTDNSICSKTGAVGFPINVINLHSDKFRISWISLQKCTNWFKPSECAICQEAGDRMERFQIITSRD